MAVSAVGAGAGLRAYRVLARSTPAATPTDEVMGAAAPMPSGETLRRAPVPGPEPRGPYVNARGEVTGRLIDTTA